MARQRFTIPLILLTVAIERFTLALNIFTDCGFLWCLYAVKWLKENLRKVNT